MKTPKTFSLLSLLIAVIMIAGCDTVDLNQEGSVSANAESPTSQSLALESQEGIVQFSGPPVVGILCGSAHTISYFAIHSGNQAIDLEVSGLPPGARYDISDFAGGHGKRVSVDWNSDPSEVDIRYAVELLATERSSGTSLAHSFELVCHELREHRKPTDDDPYKP